MLGMAQIWAHQAIRLQINKRLNDHGCSPRQGSLIRNLKWIGERIRMSHLARQFQRCASRVSTRNDNKHADNSIAVDLGDEGEGNVKDQDMHGPTYLALLRNLGWKDEDDENVRFSSKPSKQNDSLSVQISDSSVTHAPAGFQVRASRRHKGEIQRELLGLKRKACTFFETPRGD
ncbi:hypothetical protein F0562_014150 [Nyssa sinensis]|uniref:Uncharacterized protein n=1 Tax=Nyssa sinensis TaxID=561372 RepID=A0A5J4ZMY6_9ASTE|nr:hypothetical protein F0562_014150 [Nyssa sinensis]